MSLEEIRQVEKEIWEHTVRLEMLRKKTPPVEIKNYEFLTLEGPASLSDFFAKKDKLMVIHNMGQNCRWCTAWADILNGALPHLESEFSVILVSKDTPEAQRKLALSRKWRFRMASHGGREYITEQSIISNEENVPGLVCYQRRGEKIFRKNSSKFYPGDVFNPIFHVLSVGEVGLKDFQPQFNYWTRPEKLDESMSHFELTH